MGKSYAKAWLAGYSAWTCYRRLGVLLRPFLTRDDFDLHAWDDGYARAKLDERLADELLRLRAGIQRIEKGTTC